MPPTAETIETAPSGVVTRISTLGSGAIPDCVDKPIVESNVGINSSEKSSTTSDEERSCEMILNALTEEEANGLVDKNMLRRHLRAEKGNVESATVKIKATLAWRKEFDVETIIKCASGCPKTLSKIAFENETGKTYVRGYDRKSRAILYLRPGVENSTDVDWNLRHLVYNIERAIACTQKKSQGQVEKINIVLDFYKFRLRSAPSLSTSKATLDILQNHYPERLNRAYICNPPRVFRAFWALVKPFIDPVTKEKICFCVGSEGEKTLKDDFELKGMEECAGGDGSLREFDSKEYLETPFEISFDELN